MFWKPGLFLIRAIYWPDRGFFEDPRLTGVLSDWLNVILQGEATVSAVQADSQNMVMNKLFVPRVNEGNVHTIFAIPVLN